MFIMSPLFFLLNIFTLSVDEARLSNLADSPTRSETTAVNEGSLLKKKKKEVNCSTWVVGKVGQAQYISIKQGREEGKRKSCKLCQQVLHACSCTDHVLTCDPNIQLTHRVSKATTSNVT